MTLERKRLAMKFQQKLIVDALRYYFSGPGPGSGLTEAGFGPESNDNLNPPRHSATAMALSSRQIPNTSLLFRFLQTGSP